MMNLAAPFICTDFYENVLQILPYVDILFSNDTEAREFSKKAGLGDNLDDIASKISLFKKVDNGSMEHDIK